MRQSRIASAWAKMRGELEDLAFMHLEPEAYNDLIEQIDEKRQANDEILQRDEGRCPAKTRAGRHSGACRRPAQTSLLRLPEAQTPENPDRPGL